MTIVDLAQFFKPTLTLIDGIRIMTRNGPSGGSTTDVVQKNTLILSNDPVAADAVGARHGLVAAQDQQVFRFEIEPRLNTLLLNLLGYAFDQRDRVRVKFTRFLMDEEGDRHTPGPLPGDTPVGPIFDHPFDACLAPIGGPADLLDLGHRFIAQLCLVH